MEKFNAIREKLNDLVYQSCENHGSNFKESGDSSKVNPTRPRSYEDFKKRVETYLHGKWTAKPVNPLICSQYGWRCIEKDLLQCSSCLSVVVGHLPPITNYFIYEECRERLMSNIKAGHKALCPWANLPSPSSFTRVFLPEAPQIEEFLCKQLDRLLPVVHRHEKVQKIVSIIKEEDLVPVLQALKLPHDIHHLVTLTLVMNGWEYDVDANSLKCNYCYRNLPFLTWLGSADVIGDSVNDDETGNVQAIVHSKKDLLSDQGHPIDSHERTMENLDASNFSNKKMKVEDLNICDQHRYWCPWIEGDPCGCEQFLSAVNQLTFIKQNPTLLNHPDYANKVSGIMKIRSLMDEW